jgi:HEAT repeat protein
MPLFGKPNVENMKANRDIKGLKKALRNSDESISLSAVAALGDIGDTEAIEALADGMKSRHSAVQKETAEALGRIGSDQAVDGLIAALRLNNPAKLTAIFKLSDLGNPRAVPALANTLTDYSQEVREASALALGATGSDQAVEPLLGVLLDVDEDVRINAAMGLDKIGWQPGMDEDGARYWIATASMELSGGSRSKSESTARVIEIGAPAVKLLVSILKGEITGEGNFVTKAWAADTLGKIGEPQCVEPLVAALHDPDMYVRAAAVDGLGKIGELRCVEPLVAALQDHDLYVRAAAAKGLGEIGEPQCVEPIVAALQDSEEFVRSNAAEALGEIGEPQCVKPLLAALKDRNELVRTAAAKALIKVENAQSVKSAESIDHRPVEGKTEIVAGDVLAMAIVYEGHVVEDPNGEEIARELVTRFSEANILKDIRLNPYSGNRIRRADEEAWYRGDYEPGDELPQMLDDGIADLRNHLQSEGQLLGEVAARTVTLKGSSRVVGTCWVGIHICQ